MSVAFSAWLDKTHASIHRLSLAMLAVDDEKSLSVLMQFAKEIDAPPDPVGRAILASLLLDVCRRSVDRLHRSSAQADCACLRISWARLTGLLGWQAGDPRAAFRAWLDSIVEQIAHEHPPGTARKAARLLRSDPSRAKSLHTLALESGAATSRRLCCEFRRQFGITPAKYAQLVRVTHAVLLLTTPMKVEAIAWEVGYRNRKELYVALKHWTGLRPREVTALPGDERESLLWRLEVYCARGTSAATRRASLF